MKIAKERVREKTGTRQYLMFEFLVLKEWSAAHVAKKFQASIGQVYFARRTAEKLLTEEVKWLRFVSEKRIRRRRATR